MRRLTRGRAATDDEGTPQATAASEPVSATPDAQQGGVSVPANGTAGEEPETAVLPVGDAGSTPPTGEMTAPQDAARDLPAGVDPAELATAPTSAKRSRLRRRLRYLRAVRELLLRDIGGFYYEAQRSEQGVDSHRRLLEAKTSRLTRLDDEVRDLESRLDESHPQTVLRKPGLGGTCPQCGELHSSDARYCSRCGAALTGGAKRARKATAKSTTSVPGTTARPAVAAASEDSKATTASLWGRPKRPDPATASAGDETRATGAGDETRAAGETRATAGADDAAAAKDDAAAKQVDEPAPTGSERT